MQFSIILYNCTTTRVVTKHFHHPQTSPRHGIPQTPFPSTPRKHYVYVCGLILCIFLLENFLRVIHVVAYMGTCFLTYS